MRSKKHIYRCHTCGESVNRTPSIKRDGTVSDKVFCDRSCYQKFHAEKISTVICNGCSKKFEYVVSRSNGKYCSVTCRRKYRISSCIVCSVEFSGIKYRGKCQKGYARVEFQTCDRLCLAEFYRTDENRKRKISDSVQAEKHWNYKDGKSRERNTRGPLRKLLRDRVFKEYGENCLECGMSRETSKLKYKADLHIDHRIPWRSFENKIEANKMSNLRPLCNSCHQKIGAKHQNKSNHKKSAS